MSKLFLIRMVLWVSLMLGLATAVQVQAATSLNGVWSLTGNAYLTLMQDSASGTVVALQVNATVDSGSVYVGARSGDVVVLQAIDRNASMNLTFSGNSFAGTQTVSGSTSNVDGQLLLAYQGSANDGIWQRNGVTGRYLLSLSLIANNVSLMLLVDVAIDATTQAVTYDVSTGTVAGTTPTFVGRSLTTGRTVTLVFKGGSPALASYSAVEDTRPPHVVEQFDVIRLLVAAP